MSRTVKKMGDDPLAWLHGAAGAASGEKKSQAASEPTPRPQPQPGSPRNRAVSRHAAESPRANRVPVPPQPGRKMPQRQPGKRARNRQTRNPVKRSQHRRRLRKDRPWKQAWDQPEKIGLALPLTFPLLGKTIRPLRRKSNQMLRWFRLPPQKTAPRSRT